MKRYKYLALGLAMTLGVSSCSLDTEVYDQKDGETAFATLKDIKNSLHGSYYRNGYYAFLGNYAVTIGDMASGISAGDASSGHMYSYSTFTFTETEGELESMWNYGYKIVTNATTTINNAIAMLESGAINEASAPEAQNYIAQLYSLKALANYVMVNYFALPYSEANKSKLGLIVIDKEISEIFAPVTRGTLAETYAQINKDIASAEAAFAAAGEEVETSAYYMTPMALQALKARVLLSMGDYAGAEAAAKEAIALKGTGDATAADAVPSDLDYLTMWSDLAESDEDIFTIKKSTDDNLSANSINTLYGSYKANLQNEAISKLGKQDIRRNLLRDGLGGGTSMTKFDGIPGSAATSNIPVFRKSEMALIVAECAARQGDLDEAKDYLMFTAKRDKAITGVDDLPATADELLAFIADERVREFFGEGHRFFDARRMGIKVSGDQFQNWDIQNFVFPIPEGEINTGTGCQQNEGWSDFLPEM